MKKATPLYANIDDYIEQFPTEVQKKLTELRKIILDAAPDAEEVISYQMPAFKVNGERIVYFAGYKKHIGFYPFPSGVEEFERITGQYSKSGKGTIQFLLDQELPADLIKKIVKFRIEEVKKK